MKKLLASFLSLALLLALVPAVAFADTTANLTQANGSLEITEPGTYVLTGAMRGTVHVNAPGDVILVLDGADINGMDHPAIVAERADSLSIRTAPGSVNRVSDERGDRQKATIFTKVDTVFDGFGTLYVRGNDCFGIRADGAGMTFMGGAYGINAAQNGLSATGPIFLNGGSLRINGGNGMFDPASGIQMGDAVVVDAAQDPGSSTFVVPQAPAQGFIPNQSSQVTQPEQDQNSRPSAPQAPAQNLIGHSAVPLPSAQGQGRDASNASEMPGGEAPTDSMQQSYVSGASATEIVKSSAVNTAADLEADYENATYITVTDDDSQVKITSSGTYVVTGSASDGNITVKKGTTGVVLVLDDLDLCSTTGATVSVNKEAVVKIIISGSVVLTDNENPDDEDSEDADVADAFDGAALKFKANSQVYVTGDGTLTIYGNAKNGIKAGDETSVIFDGVTVNIATANDGINANYDLTLLSGDFTIEAGDDAIHADHILTIGSEDGNGPTVRVTGCNEGLEATVVNLFGGNVSIVSKDDAINAANGDGLYEGELDYSFNMTGGKVVIKSSGDGVDSNGNVNLIGGSMQISSASTGGEAGIDYDGQLYISDAFRLNNNSGVEGPDGMGGMPGQMNGAFPQEGRQDRSQNGQMSGGQEQPGMPGGQGQDRPGK